MEKPDDAEAPLLTNYDGIEYASCDRPSKLINGRASFKLKISQVCKSFMTTFTLMRLQGILVYYIRQMVERHGSNSLYA